MASRTDFENLGIGDRARFKAVRGVLVKQLSVMDSFEEGCQGECRDRKNPDTTENWKYVFAPVWNWEGFEYRVSQMAPVEPKKAEQVRPTPLNAEDTRRKMRAIIESGFTDADFEHQLAVMQCYIEGEKIECRSKGVPASESAWGETDSPSWNWAKLDYRVQRAPVKSTDAKAVQDIRWFAYNVPLYNWSPFWKECTSVAEPAPVKPEAPATKQVDPPQVLAEGGGKFPQTSEQVQRNLCVAEALKYKETAWKLNMPAGEWCRRVDVIDDYVWRNKQVQTRCHDSSISDWFDVPFPAWNWQYQDYRIKPETEQVK